MSDMSFVPEEINSLTGLCIIKKGSLVYHGTRWQQGQEKWWVNDFPRVEDKDDGGICYCLDNKSSPKIKIAQVLITFEVIHDIRAKICKNKGQFQHALRDNDAAWTHAENELRINLDRQHLYLKYKTDSTSGWWDYLFCCFRCCK